MVQLQVSQLVWWAYTGLVGVLLMVAGFLLRQAWKAIWTEVHRSRHQLDNHEGYLVQAGKEPYTG